MARTPQQEVPSATLLTSLLRSMLAELELSLGEAQLVQMATYFALLLRWNQKVNLTSVRTPAEMAWRHFGESLFLAKLMGAPPGGLGDVGSGAGFPGLVLKIAWPATQTVLLEPNGKKAAFLKEVIRACNISGVQVRTERLEEQTTGDLFWPASLLTVRAVKLSGQLLASARRLLAPEGRLALFVGADDAAELSAQNGFTWQAPAPIPHSERRVVLLGSKSSAVQE